MKIELDNDISLSNKIISYSDDSFQLKDKLITSNLVISNDRLIENWTIDSYCNLATQHLDEFISWQPEIILIGTGTVPSFPNPDLIAYVTSRSIGLEIMDTGAACRSYNLIINEGRNVVAILFLPNS